MKSKQKQTPTEIIENQRQAVVEKIIEDMKRDGLRWAEPYLPSLTPHNPVSGTVYQGGNRVHLGFIGFMRGYTDNRWATFNQIKDAGWHVKKGAKSALIEKWKQFAFYKENEDTGEKELAGRYPKLVGYWNVFNAEDIEGIPPENAPVHQNDRTAIIAQNLEKSSRCPVIENNRSRCAAYFPVTDRIRIAPRETFRSDVTVIVAIERGDGLLFHLIALPVEDEVPEDGDGRCAHGFSFLPWGGSVAVPLAVYKYSRPAYQQAGEPYTPYILHIKA